MTSGTGSRAKAGLRADARTGGPHREIKSSDGTALIPAAERGHVETVRRLIAAGVDVNHVNRLHWTALLEAVMLGDGGPRHQHVVELLLAAGADPALADGDGVTALAQARRRGYTEIAAILQRAGARE